MVWLHLFAPLHSNIWQGGEKIIIMVLFKKDLSNLHNIHQMSCIWQLCMCLTALVFHKGVLESWFFIRVKWPISLFGFINDTVLELKCVLYYNVLVFRSEQLLQLQINNKRRFASHPADSAFTASTWSLSLSVKFSLAARDLMTSMESFIWISFAKTWPITKRKQKKMAELF